MSVDNDIVLFFVAQSIIIVMALVAAYTGIKVQLAKQETKVDILQVGHEMLNRKVDGISRAVARLESGAEHGD